MWASLAVQKVDFNEVPTVRRRGVRPLVLGELVAEVVSDDKNGQMAHGTEISVSSNSRRSRARPEGRVVDVGERPQSGIQ